MSLQAFLTCFQKELQAVKLLDYCYEKELDNAKQQSSSSIPSPSNISMNTFIMVAIIVFLRP